MRSNDLKKQPSPNYMEEYDEEEGEDTNDGSSVVENSPAHTPPQKSTATSSSGDSKGSERDSRMETLEGQVQRILAIMEANPALTTGGVSPTSPRKGAAKKTTMKGKKTNVPASKLAPSSGRPGSRRTSRAPKSIATPTSSKRDANRGSTRKRKQPSHRRKNGKKQRMSTEYTTDDSADSEEESTDDDEDNCSDDGVPYDTQREGDKIPKVRFDIETLTGKPPKRRNGKSKMKYRYPRPYMFLPRPILSKVKERDSADDLSFQEYVWGMSRLIMHVHKHDDAVALLLNHIACVAEDTLKFNWEDVRCFSNTCFDRAERKEITWRDREEIKDERIKLSWISGPKMPRVNQPCHAFNTEGCDKPDRHESDNIIFRHRCAVCW